MDEISNQLLQGLKDLLATKAHADVVLKISEERSDGQSSTVPLVNGSAEQDEEEVVIINGEEKDEEKPPEEVPQTDSDVTSIEVHGILLYLHSPFFKSLMDEQDYGKKFFDIRVKPGQTKYMKVLISAFYDASILDSMKVNDLLRLMEIALKYSSDVFVRRIDILLQQMKIKDYDDCVRILLWVSEIECSQSTVRDELLVSVKRLCTSYMVNEFTPLELRTDAHGKFLHLPYYIVELLLTCGDGIAFSENSLLMFVMQWFKADTTHPTARNVERLLQLIRVKFLSPLILFHHIGVDNTLLNCWPGYKEWFLHAISFFALPDDVRMLKHSTMDGQIARTRRVAVPPENQACRWLVPMQYSSDYVFESTGSLHMFDGCLINLVSVTFTRQASDPVYYSAALKIQTSGTTCNLRLVLGLFVRSNIGNINEIVFGSSVAQSLLKWSPPLSFKSSEDTLSVDFWTASQRFLDAAKEFGLLVALLPMSSETCLTLSKRFTNCPKCRRTDLNVFSYCCSCGVKGTFQGPVIHLT